MSELSTTGDHIPDKEEGDGGLAEDYHDEDEPVAPDRVPLYPELETSDEDAVCMEMKTLCIDKKCVKMPSSDEHKFLIFCGLGKKCQFLWNKWYCQAQLQLKLRLRLALISLSPATRPVTHPATRPPKKVV